MDANDSRNTATNLGLISPAQTWSNWLIDSSTDVDWYRFDIGSTGGIGDQVRLNFSHASGDLDMRLYSSSGSEIARSESVSNVEEMSLSGRSAGTYYIQVYGYGGATNTYSLTVDGPASGGGSTGDRYESNNTRTSAADLGTISSAQTVGSLSIHTGSDRDWFQFDIGSTGGSTDEVRIDFTHASGDLDMRLYNSAGNLLATSDSVNNFEEISLNGRSAGTYYAEVYGYSGATNTYSLTLDGPASGGSNGSGSNGSGSGSTNSIHLLFGNPSGAVTNASVSDNYLLVRDQYAMSYNDNRRIANWVGWQLNDSWLGNVSRQNDFRADTLLPNSFTQVGNSYNFSTYGFARGHVTPSADRTATVTDNSNTFFMSNMMPQSPRNNSGVWGSFENYLRTLVPNQDLYIYAGGRGTGGTSSQGSFNTITDSNGVQITVPAYTWKTVLVVDEGETPNQVSSDDYMITVDMPNSQSVSGTSWQDWVIDVDTLESSTGFDFFSELPNSIETALESGSNGGGGSTPETIFINEIHYDNAGSDSGEGIEIAGTAGVNLNGWSVALYNGNGGGVYRTESLTGSIPNQQNGYGTVSVPIAGIQNGRSSSQSGAADAIALVDDANQVVQFLSYEGTLTATSGPASGTTSQSIGVSESSSTPVGSSLQLTGSGNSYDDFNWSTAANTFGSINVAQTFVS